MTYLMHVVELVTYAPHIEDVIKIIITPPT